jgi:hypothetical protein
LDEEKGVHAILMTDVIVICTPDVQRPSEDTLGQGLLTLAICGFVSVSVIGEQFQTSGQTVKTASARGLMAVEPKNRMQKWHSPRAQRPNGALRNEKNRNKREIEILTLLE